MALSGPSILVDGSSIKTERPAAHPSVLSDYVPGSVADASAHNWNSSIVGNTLQTSGRWLVDGWGRVCLPRGVNLAAASKLPTNHDSTTFPLDREGVTFLGRPFPLEDAPEHFARLRRWGLTLVRFLITWEAVEHAGPGIIDFDYLSYVRELLSLMDKFGIIAFVSMHQDVWSRYCGGSGAPAWTLEAVGFNLLKLEECGAAYLGGVRTPGVDVDRGRWPTGYLKLASSTMWTCFWAGDIFAPKLKVKNVNGDSVGIQSFLQSAFLNCFDNVARILGSLPSVLGFELLNEPHQGYVGVSSLHEFDFYKELHFHDTPSPLQTFALGAGHSVEIPHYVRSFPMPTRLSHRTICNSLKASTWRADGPTDGRCLWEMHGVWAWDRSKRQPIVLREGYFARHPITGAKVDWYTDCWYPMVNEWGARVHALAGGDKLLFVEGIPNEFCPSSWTPQRRPRNMIYAPHWYDLNALFTKTFGNITYNVQGLSRGMSVLKAIYFGAKGAKTNYALQIGTILRSAQLSLGNTPVIIGECGIPIDMNNSKAFTTNDFSWQERMMDALMGALETNLSCFTLWNYNPENTDQEGDFWNGENFSWFSQNRARESQGHEAPSLSQGDATLDKGARLLDVICRPYPAKIAGIPESFSYDPCTEKMLFTFSNPCFASPTSDGRKVEEDDSSYGSRSLVCRETEIFLPAYLARNRKPRMKTSHAKDSLVYDQSRQTLFLVHNNTAPGVLHTFEVSFDPPLTYPILSILLKFTIVILPIIAFLVGPQVFQ